MRFDAMDLKLYDTLTREKRVFAPLDPANVRMYVCGPTVYDFAHIGNARPVIVFDVLFRLLGYLAKQGLWDGGRGETKVTYVRNITDVDDKINARAAERGIEIGDLTRETYEAFKSDVRALGCLDPTFEPRATDYIHRYDGQFDMVTLIKALVANNCAYVAEGHVLFRVDAMPDYGKLARRSLDEMIAGARVEVAPYKDNPMDFVLWKPSKPGEPAWDSPWGRGRPGWHIECSAMSAALLGKTFDIHGGGIDLVFPHHENEIAQSRCAFHTPVMANYWMHNGFLQVEGEKMSKSLGNFVTIHELLKDWPGEVVRLAMLQTHYRQPINWTLRSLEISRQILQKWYSIIGDIEPLEQSDVAFRNARYDRALGDDLNTPLAISRLHGIASVIENGATLPEFSRREFKTAANFLGLLEETESTWRNRVEAIAGVNETAVDRLILQRTAARARKDFKESDRIRDELAKMVVVLKDSKDGTTWEIAR
jgi:cysteinyl-tRNA synthetase